MQKTEQKTEQQAGLGMSFCEEEGRITVFRKTLEALEWPSHYRFLYNRKMKTSLDKGTQRKTTENELPSLTQCTA